MFNITPRQQAFLDFIRDEIARTGAAPTMREIEAGVGTTSRSFTVKTLDALERRGRIRRLPYAARSITLVSTD